MNKHSQDTTSLNNMDINTMNTGYNNKHVSRYMKRAVGVVHNSSRPPAKTAKSVWRN